MKDSFVGAPPAQLHGAAGLHCSTTRSLSSLRGLPLEDARSDTTAFPGRARFDFTATSVTAPHAGLPSSAGAASRVPATLATACPRAVAVQPATFPWLTQSATWNRQMPSRSAPVSQRGSQSVQTTVGLPFVADGTGVPDRTSSSTRQSFFVLPPPGTSSAPALVASQSVIASNRPRVTA